MPFEGVAQGGCLSLIPYVLHPFDLLQPLVCDDGLFYEALSEGYVETGRSRHRPADFNPACEFSD